MANRSTRDFDKDDWDEDAFDADDEEPTEPCPHCKREIHEDAEKCPYCGNWISDEENLPTQKPTWIVVTTLICLLIVILWIFGH